MRLFTNLITAGVIIGYLAIGTYAALAQSSIAITPQVKETYYGNPNREPVSETPDPEDPSKASVPKPPTVKEPTYLTPKMFLSIP